MRELVLMSISYQEKLDSFYDADSECLILNDLLYYLIENTPLYQIMVTDSWVKGGEKFPSENGYDISYDGSLSRKYY